MSQDEGLGKEESSERIERIGFILKDEQKCPYSNFILETAKVIQSDNWSLIKAS